MDKIDIILISIVVLHVTIMVALVIIGIILSNIFFISLFQIILVLMFFCLCLTLTVDSYLEDRVNPPLNKTKLIVLSILDTFFLIIIVLMGLNLFFNYNFPVFEILYLIRLIGAIIIPIVVVAVGIIIVIEHKKRKKRKKTK
ncbi:MAG: hypothetical protein ACFFAH_03675 [Promethearchaeota archaeon]